MVWSIYIYQSNSQELTDDVTSIHGKELRKCFWQSTFWLWLSWEQRNDEWKRNCKLMEILLQICEMISWLLRDFQNATQRWHLLMLHQMNVWYGHSWNVYRPCATVMYICTRNIMLWQVSPYIVLKAWDLVSSWSNAPSWMYYPLVVH